MAKVLTIGEPMGLLVATEPKALKDVTQFTRYVCGAEVNFAVGMSRLGHKTAYISRVGNDPFGQHILDFLQEQGITTDYIELDEINRTGMQEGENAGRGSGSSKLPSFYGILPHGTVHRGHR